MLYDIREFCATVLMATCTFVVVTVAGLGIFALLAYIGLVLLKAYS